MAPPGSKRRPGSPEPQQLSLTQTGGAGEPDDRLSGTIERVTYHDPESGFCVLQVRTSGRRDLVTVVGRVPSATAGEGLRADGRYERDPKHGLQFRASELQLAPPSTPEGAQKYLASGAVRGIGPELARRLVEAFGDRVFDVIERAPQQLREVEGVGVKRAESISRSFVTQRNLRELMLFLHSHGLGTARAMRIHRTYGANAVARIRDDPYRLARDVRGIGFATADQLAQRLGVAKDASVRLRAGLHHVLDDEASHGHCAVLESEAIKSAATLLGVGETALLEALQHEIGAERIVPDSVAGARALFQPRLYGAEREAAARLRALAEGSPPWRAIDTPRALDWVQEQLDVELPSSQREALARALASKVAVLTGGPGVGKTTLVRALLAILRERDVRVELAAPTGRAAKRLAEASQLEARTLHRLLEFAPHQGGFRRGVELPLDCDLVVVDEASMVDITLFAALLRAIPRHAALLLVGDADQLPSVGPGRVLADLIESEAVPVLRLREVFRQAAESGIVRSAHRIREGELPELDGGDTSDFYFVECEDPERAVDRVVSAVRERIPARFGFDALRDVQVLTPMHRGALGAQNLNAALQQALNPQARDGPRLERGEIALAPGDKVLQTENDYDRDVFNGDIGTVLSIDVEEASLAVDFDGRRVEYEASDLDALTLAYAITVHKAQGSEYPAVVIALSTQHYPMLERRLVYTAITRGKQLVVIVGQRRALEIALRRGAQSKRTTKLREWLSA